MLVPSSLGISPPMAYPLRKGTNDVPMRKVSFHWMPIATAVGRCTPDQRCKHGGAPFTGCDAVLLTFSFAPVDERCAREARGARAEERDSQRRSSLKKRGLHTAYAYMVGFHCSIPPAPRDRWSEELSLSPPATVHWW